MQLSQQMPSVGLDEVAPIIEVLARPQLPQQMSEAAAVHKGVENEYGKMVLERPSPQLMGEFNNDGAARAQTLDPRRERLILQVVGVMLLNQTATASKVQVRSKHEMHLERPSPQLTGRFTNCNTTRAHALDPYRARLSLVGVILFACHSTFI